MPYEAMTLQVAFLHEGTSQNFFSDRPLRQLNGFNDLQQNRMSFGDI